MLEGDRPPLLSSAMEIALIVSVVTLVVSAVASFIARSAESVYKGIFGSLAESVELLVRFPQFRKRLPASGSIPRGTKPTPSQVARERVKARLQETKAILQKQASAARWSRVSNNSLTVGQYVVGGLLASSFVQESLSQSKNLVGSLGLLVLLASLIKQHFHPELSAQNATRKAAQLTALVRRSEDELAILDAMIASGQDHTDAMISLLMKTTERLTEIETPEVVEQRPPATEKTG